MQDFKEESNFLAPKRTETGKDKTLQQNNYED